MPTHLAHACQLILQVFDGTVLGIEDILEMNSEYTLSQRSHKIIIIIYTHPKGCTILTLVVLRNEC